MYLRYYRKHSVLFTWSLQQSQQVGIAIPILQEEKQATGHPKVVSKWHHKKQPIFVPIILNLNVNGEEYAEKL